jgi:hypothetical protein
VTVTAHIERDVRLWISCLRSSALKGSHWVATRQQNQAALPSTAVHQLQAAYGSDETTKENFMT